MQFNHLHDIILVQLEAQLLTQLRLVEAIYLKMKYNYPNPKQPKRPETCPDNPEVKLAYRTHVSKPTAVFPLLNSDNIISSVALYRWLHSDDYLNGVGLGALAEFLEYDYQFSTKRAIGSSINQALRYDPRVMKGVTQENPRAQWTLVLPSRWDLIFGLEWMLCIWLQEVVPNQPLDSTLKELVECDTEDLPGLFLKPLGELTASGEVTNINWEHYWTENDLCPEEYIKERPRDRPLLKSLLK